MVETQFPSISLAFQADRRWAYPLLLSPRKGKFSRMEKERYKMKPTLVDIRWRLTAAAMFAEIYGESHPEHTEHLHRFVKDIQKISKELGESIRGKPIMD
jgi:hypothetical protein